ncbi:MAG: ribulose-phosphate 3-epimerase [archaeon]|nr:ribulose-phosphate 3-epimerase [archaeon]
MKPKIFPSIMGKSQKEINGFFKKLAGVAETLHLDVADGKFVPNKSLWFDFKLSSKFKYNAHLMIENPKKWIEKYGDKVDLCIIHEEAVEDLGEFISWMKTKKKKVGLALKPETKVSSIKKYLSSIDYVLILTVHPGFYGGKYLKAPLRKIEFIKKINPRIKTIVDGGMNPRTVKDTVKSKADFIVSGSFTTKSDNPKESLRLLRGAM